MTTVNTEAPMSPIIAIKVAFDGYRICKLKDYKAG